MLAPWITLIAYPNTKSAKKKKIDAKATITSTIAVEIIVSRRDGQVTLDVSVWTCLMKVTGLVLEAIECSRL